MNQHRSPLRYLVTAQLVTATPLAIHSGLSFKEWKLIEGRQDPQRFRAGNPGLDDCDQLIARDWEDRPYIPGSALKGVLSSFLQNYRRPTFSGTPFQASELHERVFGRESFTKNSGAGGAVTFEDAFLISGNGDATASRASAESFQGGSWRGENRAAPLTTAEHLPYWSAEQQSYVEQHVVINRRTGTSNKHQLFNQEVVPAGLAFQLRLSVDARDPIDADCVRFLLAGLAGFNLDLVHRPPQLGSNTGLSWGLVDCCFDKVAVTNRFAFEPDTAWDRHHVVAKLTEALAAPPAAQRAQVRLRLEFESALLVNDPSQVKATKNGEEKKAGDPDHFPRVAERGPKATISKLGELNYDPQDTGERGRALVPSASFKGSLRSQVERILRTIHPDLHVSPFGQCDPVDDRQSAFVHRLLGSTNQASGIITTDFAASVSQPILLQEMAAIDRWTGGVAGSKKFDTRFFHRPILTGCLCVDLRQDPLAVIGLLALLLRDLIEGDVTFGAASSKGYGVCRASIESIVVGDPPAVESAVTVGRTAGDWNQALAAAGEAVKQGEADSDVVARFNTLLNDALQSLRQLEYATS